MKRLWRVLLVAGFFAVNVYAGVGEWKTFTSKREVRDIAGRDGVYWVATNGGLFAFRQSDSSFVEFTTSEGLRSADITAVTIDKRDRKSTRLNSSHRT